MAKKTKPVKPASPKGGKALVKKAAPKKAVAKKTPAKKVAAKKTTPGSPVKKAAIKKPVAKKAAPKKTIKKTASVKSVAKPLPTPVVKKKATKPKSLPAMDSLPPVTELSEELLEKAAHTGSKSAPVNGSNEAPVKTEDPIKSFDKNVFNKATSKGDPHSKLHLSSKPKNSIKPSGKKPLW